ncbi:MAG: phosphotransferase [Nocardioidaceae bacterium]
MDEQVALYDEQGRPCGSAPRSRMRAENLRHAATAVVVRDPWGRVYVHRRTDTKDVYPGRRDFAAGGVVAAGEDPFVAAVRELEEELGVAGVPLTSLGEGDYADAHTDYHGFCFTSAWDGPVRWQPEEVVSGEWMTTEDLVAAFTDDPEDFMPDTVGLLGDWMRSLAADRVRPEQGWDCVTEVVEGRWVDRRPRRPEVDSHLLVEALVLPRIADSLPLTVPRPVVLSRAPLLVRHALVPGEPCDPDRLTAEDGRRVGEFLRALHAIDPVELPELPSAEEEGARRLDEVADFRARVLPLLTSSARSAGADLLDEISEQEPFVLTHADLGPSHLLADGPRVSGVIDWADVRLGDAGLDLAWTLHGTPEVFAQALSSSYGVDEALRRRSLLWHRLGPWWEVIAGLDHLGPAFVDSGLAGAVSRLPTAGTS